MKSGCITLCALLLLCGCGSSMGDRKLYGMMDNTREFGTVVSVEAGSHVTASHLDSAATGAAAGGTGSFFGSMLSGAGSLLSPLSGSVSQAGNMIKGNSQQASVDEVNDLSYVVEKEDGTKISILQTPEADEPVLYPGQRVMIQTNSGYTRIYSADVEHRRGGGA